MTAPVGWRHAAFRRRCANRLGCTERSWLRRRFDEPRCSRRRGCEAVRRSNQSVRHTARTRISALDSHQNVVASVRTVNGEFSLDLAPGIYTVLAEENGYLFGKVAVDAVAHHATRANIIVTVK
jgi:hypothetical protein